MSLKSMPNISNRTSSLCPTNGRQTVGDGASLPFDTDASVIAVCHLQGTGDKYYYSTTFSGGPEQINKLNNVGRPVTIPRVVTKRSGSNSWTPPLTPDGGSDCGSIELPSPPTHAPINPREDADQGALEFLMNVFPCNGLQALPYAKKVSISALNMGAVFDGVVLELPNQPKALYVDGKSAEAVSLRESIVALLDLADESLGCSALVIVLERASPKLSSLLHSLMYVGGSVVTKPVYEVDPAYVLVGLEI